MHRREPEAVHSSRRVWTATCFKIVTRYTCVFSHVYLQSFLLHDIRAFFLPRILAFFPALWGLYSQVQDHFLTNAHIYAQKKPIYMCYKQACENGVTESRRIRDI